MDYDEMSAEELGKLFPIKLECYKEEWINIYNHEEKLLWKELSQSIENLHHIGSTSVEGLIAKPTIDILMEIKNDCDINRLKEILIHMGYRCSEQKDRPAPHLMFLKGYTDQGFKGQAFHIHVRYLGDWDELYFRDYLRTHSQVKNEYAELKIGLQKLYPFNREAYTDAKGSFIRKYTNIAKKEYTYNKSKEMVM